LEDRKPKNNRTKGSKMIKTIAITTLALCVMPLIAQASYAEIAPVPEPSTIFAGALLLVPFGISAVRALRRK
jgi:hypothetical protein